MIYDTPKVAIFGALTRYVYSNLLFTQVGVAFLNIWIQSGSTMWLCDELLTIVVIALVNRFVHGRVPTAVSVCMKVQADLRVCCSHAPKTGFLASKPILLKLLDDVGKRGEIQGLSSILWKFINNTGERTFDFSWHENDCILTLCIQNCYEHHSLHNVTK